MELNARTDFAVRVEKVSSVMNIYWVLNLDIQKLYIGHIILSTLLQEQLAICL